MERGPLKCLEISQRGYRVVFVEPGHPEYEDLLRRDEEAGQVLDRHRFETEALRSPWSVLFWL